MAELRERVTPLKDLVVNKVGNILLSLLVKMAKALHSSDELVQYLEVKQHMLLSYCINVTFYLLMKAEGRSVRSHPVMRRLLELRYGIEKLRSIDAKLKYQIDRLLKQAKGVTDQDMPSSSARPNPMALMDEEEEDFEDRGTAKEKVYRAPRMAAVPYHDDKDRDKVKERLERKKKRIRSSEMFEAMREEFGNEPEEFSSSGVTQSADLKALEKEAEERREFEEERFVRLTLSRKEKKDMTRRQREAGKLDSINSIGDIADLEDFNDIAAIASAGASENKSRTKGISNRRTGEDNLEKAMRVLQEFDDDEPITHDIALSAGGENTGNKRRRPLPEPEDDEEENLLEAFSKRKKEFQSKKKEHYTAEPRYGGIEEVVEDGEKRAASYEIMKNKGLTPHRKKANRNPRVKKRQAYDKAMVRRKGQVREVITGAAAANYGGELTGIKKNIARSRRISN